MKVKPFVRCSCLVALVMAVVSVNAGAQVLEQIPGDALVALHVKNLQAVNSRLGTMAQDFGLAAQEPKLGDILGTFLQDMGIKEGLDKGGDMAIVLFDPDKVGGRPDKAGLLLLPITDYKAFIGNFAGAKKDGDFDLVQFGPNSSFVANWGKYAAISEAKEVLAKKPGGLKMEGAVGKFLSDKKTDIGLYVNMKLVRDKALPELKNAKAMGLANIDRDLARTNTPEPIRTFVRTLLSQVVDKVQEGLQSSQGAGLGLSLTKEGIGFAWMFEMDSTSAMGKDIASIQTTDASLLAGIPAGEHLMYGGLLSTPALATRIIDEFTNPLMASLKDTGDTGKPVITMIETMKSSLKAMNGFKFGMLIDPNAAQTGMFRSVSVIDGDSKVLMENQDKMRKAGEEFAALMPVPDNNAPAKATVTPKAKTVDGVSFDLINQKFPLDRKDPRQAIAGEIVGRMFGANGMQSYTGAVDAKHLVQITGDDEALMSAVIKAAKADEDTLGKQAGLKELSEKMPGKHFAVFYLAVDRAMANGVKIANATMGQRLKLQLPPNLPPIGNSLTTEGSALRGDVYISNQLLQAIMAASMQMQMQMKQGGGKPGDL